MGIKRLIVGLVVIGAVVGGLFYMRGRQTEKVLRVFTWSNYFPESLLEEFTKETGLKVELTYMSSNEEMLAKLKAGATDYDIIQPSDYMVRQMLKLSMLSPLDHSLLPNLSHLDDAYRNPPYDPGMKHTVAFSWGTTGIAVNTAKVPVSPSGAGWELLFSSPDPQHTSLLDDMREVFGGMLRLKGHSANTMDTDLLAGVKEDLQRAKNGILMFTSEPKALLLKGELNVAHIFSVDAAQASKENAAIKYYIPKEGGIRWTDSFSIPATSKRHTEAHLFINYFLDPHRAAKVVQEKFLATPNRSARLLLPPEAQADPAVYPLDEDLKRTEFLDDMGETLPALNRMWTELKS